MKLFGYEIKKYVSKEEQVDDCERFYEQYKNKVFYEWSKTHYGVMRNIPWVVCGRSGRWILIGSHSTYAEGCIKKINFESFDDVCDRSEYYCYRFVRPEKLTKKYYKISYSKRKYYS